VAKRKRKYRKKLKSIPSASETRGRKPVVIKEITEKFFYPMLNIIPEGYDGDRLGYLMDLVFGVTSRELYFCRTTEAFDMPGEKYITGTKTQPGTGKRAIAENELLLVVYDDRMDYVKIEVCREKSENNYKLTTAQWNYVKQKLRRV